MFGFRRLTRPGGAPPWWDGIASEIEALVIRMTGARKFTVASLPDPTRNEGVQVYVSDEVGGATLAFSDGTDWRRVQDRNIVS